MIASRLSVVRSVAACAIVACALVGGAIARSAEAGETPIEHGRYLVERVSTCADCHGAGLRGATLDFLAPGLPPAVARKAPRIAGLPQLSTAEAVHFFETGILPDGKQARPPMPAIRLRHADAEAVVAYLKSMH